MRIGIIGGGAIGLLFASRLSEIHKINLYCRRQEQVDSIKKQGLYLNGNLLPKDRVWAKTTEEDIEEVDLFIIATKQYHLPTLLPFLGKIPQHIPLLFLQNGMGHLDYIEDLPHTTIIVGVVEHGSLKQSENKVDHTGMGVTRIAIYRGSMEKLQSIFLKLNSPSFPFTLELDYYDMLSRKLVINAIINPLTAIFQVKNGVLLKNPHFFELMKELFYEVDLVLKLKEPERIFEQVVSVCEKTGENESSMFRDLKLGRKTEIDAIIGYLLKEGEKRQVDTKLLKFLYFAIKGLERKE